MENVETSHQLIRPIDAARMLNVSVRTLANWRSEGRGPAYVRIDNRTKYDLADVEAYIEDRKTSASQATV